MFAKAKNFAVPSDAQAQEKLVLYVYEYLLHVGAEKAAQTFLAEIGWEKNITLGDSFGFLLSWWCVFWDLYCAAPERRDTCEHSLDAKTFHDYSLVKPEYNVNRVVLNSGLASNPLVQMPLNGIPTSPTTNDFLPKSTMRFSPSASTHFSNSRMMPTHGYPSGPLSGVRMPPQIGNDFRGPTRQQTDPGMYTTNSPYEPLIGPSSYSHQSIGSLPPIAMTSSGGRLQWQPNTFMGDLKPVNYSPSPSAGNYGGPPAAGTLIRPSTQDSSNSSGETMYTLMKQSIAGDLPSEFPMDSRSEGGPIRPVGSNSMETDLNDDEMQNSLTNKGSGTPRVASVSSMSDYNLAGFDGPRKNNQTETAAILRIKESMQEEAKMFEKNSGQTEYFKQ